MYVPIPKSSNNAIAMLVALFNIAYTCTPAMSIRTTPVAPLVTLILIVSLSPTKMFVTLIDNSDFFLNTVNVVFVTFDRYSSVPRYVAVTK